MAHKAARNFDENLIKKTDLERFEVIDTEPGSFKPQELRLLDGVLCALLSLLLLRYWLFLQAKNSGLIKEG